MTGKDVFFGLIAILVCVGVIGGGCAVIFMSAEREVDNCIKHFGQERCAEKYFSRKCGGE